MHSSPPRPAFAGLLTALLCLACPLARAGDREAVERYQEAVRHWGDPDPSAALKAAEEALVQAQSKKIRANVLLLLGRLHSARVGDNAKALEYYERIIEEVSEHSPRDAPLRGIKAEALLSKGNILLADRDDREAALALYRRSHEVRATPANCDVLSQFLLRDSFAVDGAERRARLQKALAYAGEAVHLAESGGRTRPERLARLRLQRVLVLTALGEEERARKAFDDLGGEAALDEGAAYQLALLRALQGADAATVARHLRRAMSLRPTPSARNQLRRWIRSEPLFARLREDPSWKELVEDEPEAG
ncbi:MAG: hypothetical protein D6731_15810 [Planctomycetota bacterium]|nr:MAG: hypothetical protein D6731_15810 [Planctomycetota bacterium]